jgi:molybdopterin-binding protein
MSKYGTHQVASLLGVSVDTVRRWCDEGRLPTTRDENGRRLVAGRDLAAYLSEQTPPYAVDSGELHSARNRFTGIVTRVERDGVAAIVEIHAPPHRLVSLLTREAVDELDLQPGDLATASVKSTNVTVEVPRP